MSLKKPSLLMSSMNLPDCHGPKQFMEGACVMAGA